MIVMMMMMMMMMMMVMMMMMMVRSSVLPFTLGVVTDADETSDGSNRGFQLFYKQQPCA